MIYIEEYSFAKQISILKFLSQREELDMIMWLCSESKQRSFCGINLAPKDLFEGTPVTTYGNNSLAKKTKRVKATENLFIKIQNEKNTISDNCDSLVLYRPQTKRWLACMIEHENILMIDDDRLLESISKKGFNASLQAPNWW